MTIFKTLRLLGSGLCVTIGLAAPSLAHAACVGGATLKGGYGVLIQGVAANGQSARFHVGALTFDGSCGITGKVTGGINAQVSNNTITGSYGTNSDNTITVTLTLSGQSVVQTYIVGYSVTNSEAMGVETDGSAVATIDLQAQKSTKPYTLSSLYGTFATACLNAPGYSDLNYVAFYGNGSSKGIDAWNDGGNRGDAPYAQNYTVNADGTFQATLVTPGFTVYSLYGVIDNANNEIQYIYTQGSYGAVLACTGKL